MNKFKPQSIGIEVTWNCNQHCVYCYLSCNKIENNPTKNISLLVFKKILNRIWNEGIRDVYLIGGEPSIHPQFNELIKILAMHPWKNKGICTNGVGYTSDQIKILAKNFNYVSVSIRGLKETTDFITQNNYSYQSTLFFLKEMSQYPNIKIRLGLDLVSQHVGEFPKILDILQKERIRFEFVDIHRIIPIGEGKNSIFNLSLDQYQKLLVKIDLYSKRYKNMSISFEDGLPLCLIEKKFWKYIHPCQCGFSKFWVDPFGNARRCACSSGNIGNILENNISQIWNSPKMREFHSFTWADQKCLNCSQFQNKCFGGCPSSRGVEFFEKDILSPQFHTIK